MLNIIQSRRIYLSISGLLTVLSIVFLIIWGLKPGLDFTGGSLLEVEFIGSRPEMNDIRANLADLNLGSLVLQPVEDTGYLFRYQNTEETVHQEILSRLNKMADGNVADNLKIDVASSSVATTSVPVTDLSVSGNAIEQLRYDSIGPSIGQELKQKATYAIIIVLICIIAYISWVFKKVSKPVASWKYGVAAVIALFHDVIIVLGIFALLGEFYNLEINTPFIVAILTVLGYSINDTIVVFDRIRENLPKSNLDYENTVNVAINQTLARSINASLTTLLVLLSILFFGGASIRDFALALAIGVFCGTYSSVFIASPIVVIWEKIKRA